MTKSELKEIIKEVISETLLKEETVKHFDPHNKVTYQVELNHPDFYVEFQAPEGLTDAEILNQAIEEMTRNTEVWSVKIKKIS